MWSRSACRKHPGRYIVYSVTFSRNSGGGCDWPVYLILLRAFKGLLNDFKGIFEDFLLNIYPEIKRELSGKQVKKLPKPSLKLFPSTRKLQINQSVLTRVFGQGFGDGNYSFTVLLRRQNAVLQLYLNRENI